MSQPTFFSSGVNSQQMNPEPNMQQLMALILGMQNKMEALQQQTTTHESQLQHFVALEEKIKSLENTNQALRKENAELRQQIFHTQKNLNALKPAWGKPIRNNQNAPKPVNADKILNDSSVNTTQPTEPVTSEWTEVVKKPKKIKKVTPKHKEAISRGFNLITGPQGYEYVYINRSRRFTRSQVRDNLRLLGAETSRILDVAFPASNVIGLLIHVQYKDTLAAILAKAKVSLIVDFDPTAAEHIADPAHAHKSVDARQVIAMSAHSDRCLRALDYLKKNKPATVVPVASVFLAAGWVDDESVSPYVVAVKGHYTHADNGESASVCSEGSNMIF